MKAIAEHFGGTMLPSAGLFGAMKAVESPDYGRPIVFYYASSRSGVLPEHGCDLFLWQRVGIKDALRVSRTVWPL